MTMDPDVAREREELDQAERTFEQVLEDRYASVTEVDRARARVVTEAGDVAPAEREAALARAAEAEETRWEAAAAEHREHREQLDYAEDYDDVQRDRDAEAERDRQRTR